MCLVRTPLGHGLGVYKTGRGLWERYRQSGAVCRLWCIIASQGSHYHITYIVWKIPRGKHRVSHVATPGDKKQTRNAQGAANGEGIADV